MKTTLIIAALVVALAVVLFSLEAGRRADAERFDSSHNAAQAGR